MIPIYHTILLIDDDDIQNHLNRIVIAKHLQPHPAEIISFTSPVKGYDYIRNRNSSGNRKLLLLADINMPELSGWQLLEKISHLEESALEHITIYMLSSSIDPADKKRAANNPMITGYIVKPLSGQLAKILGSR